MKKFFIQPFVAQQVDEINPAAVAGQLQTMIDQFGSQGWEFYRIDSVDVWVNPGCFSWLFGGRSNSTQLNLIVFRREM